MTATATAAAAGLATSRGGSGRGARNGHRSSKQGLQVEELPRAEGEQFAHIGIGALDEKALKDILGAFQEGACSSRSGWPQCGAVSWERPVVPQ